MSVSPDATRNRQTGIPPAMNQRCLKPNGICPRPSPSDSRHGFTPGGRPQLCTIRYLLNQYSRIPYPTPAGSATRADWKAMKRPSVDTTGFEDFAPS